MDEAVTGITCLVRSKKDAIFDVFAKQYRLAIDSPLLVVDDGLSADIKRKYSEFRYIDSPKPWGICSSWNAGFKEIPEGDILIFNDDLYIHTENLDIEMSEVARIEAEIGLVVPVMTHVMNPEQYPENRQAKRYAELQRPVSSTCMYIAREVLKAVGYFDEAYDVGWGYNDKDYCRRVKRAGYKTVIAYNGFIEHGRPWFPFNQANTARPLLMEVVQEENRTIYIEKWGSDD